MIHYNEYSFFYYACFRSSLVATAGGKLTLPAVTSYGQASTDLFQTRTLHADGAGSMLDLSHVLGLTNGTNYDARLVIEALAGGVVDLRGATRIDDPSGGDTRQRSVGISADAGTIRLDTLTTFTDVNGTASGNVDGRWSSLVARNGGNITAPNLATLQGVDLSYDGTGSLPAASLRAVTSGRITASGVTLTLANLSNV
jgi:hypothetical protein